MKNFLTLLLFSLLAATSYTQAVSWELSSEPGDQPSNLATSQGTNFDNCVLSRGAGITATAGAGSMNSSAWFGGSSSTTLADAIAGNDYYDFTINTINCIFFNPTTIKIVLRSSATGPNTATLRCSSDGFTANIGTVTVTTTSTSFTFSETISPNSQSGTYRLYGYGGAAGGGTPSAGGTMRIGTSVVAGDNDLEVFATTTFVTVPQVTNITVTDGDAVPATVLTANVPGATIDWSRTPEDIAEPNLATSGMGNVPSFSADNNTALPITTTFTVHATVGNCQGPDMTFSITVNPAPCTITVDFFGNPSVCNDNGTPNDPSDDFFTQNINANFFNRPSTGDLQIVPGGDQIGTYSIPVNQIIGNSHLFVGVQLKADGTPSVVQMNFTDEPTCIDADTGPTIQPCSTPPPACTITVDFFGNPSACNDNGTPNDPLDDFFTQNVHASFFNRPATGLLQIVPGGDQIGTYSIPVNQIIGNSHLFVGVQLKADGTPSVVQMNFTDEPTCIDADTGPTVQSCSSGGASCEIIGFSFANIDPCNDNGTPSNSADDFFTVDVDVLYSNSLGGATQLLLNGPDVIVQMSTQALIGTNLTHTFTNAMLRADGQITDIQAQIFNAQVICSGIGTGPAVNSCSSGGGSCDITSVTLQNVGPCDDNGTQDPTDDFFPADVAISWVNRPSTGLLQLEPGGDAITIHNVAVSGLPANGSHTFTNVHFKADGNVTVVEVEFTIPANVCTQVITGPAVQPCSPVCDITSVTLQNVGPCDDNGTIDPIDDFFPVDVDISWVNRPATGNLQIEPGGDAITIHNVAVAGLPTSGSHTFTNVHYKADGTVTVVEVEFTIPANLCTQTIPGPTVEPCSFQPPVITCPSALTVSCASNVPAANPASVGETHDCPGAVTITHIGDVISNQTCTNRYTITRTYLATDLCDNTASCSQTITVLDNTAPTLTCPANLTVSCASLVPAASTTAVTGVSDACGGTVTITFSPDVISNQTCANRFTITRTYRATDICGNTASCSQTITVLDNTPPTLTCPPNLTVSCASLVPAANTSLVTGVSDACGGTITLSVLPDVISNQTCTNRFTITRTYRATDVCGNIGACSQTITVFDNTPPSINCPANLTVQCASLVPSVNVNNILVSDNCSGTVAVTHVGDGITNQTCLNRFTLTRTYRATDVCGNSATCAQVITVFDNTPPVITFTDPLLQGIPNGGTIYVQCEGQDDEWELPSFSTGSVSSSDNCNGTVTVSLLETLQDEGNCAVDGYINLYRQRWTATDACGNSSTAFVFVALVDEVPPVIHGVPADIEVNCDELPAPPDDVYATDECLCACVILFSESNPAPGCRDGQVIVRSWIAIDDCGNETVETQNITLIDEKGPALQIIQAEIANMPDGTILEYTCNEGGIPAFYNNLNVGSVYSTPSCGTAGTISFDEDIIQSNNCDYFGYIEERTFQWEAIDQCGNKTSLTLKVHLIDDEAPVLIGVPEMTCVGDPALNEIEAVDNCENGSVRYWDVPIPSPCGNGTALRRTYEGFDPCGNIVRDTAILLPDNNNGPSITFINSELAALSPGEILIINCRANENQYSAYGTSDIKVDDDCLSGLEVSYQETVIQPGDCNAENGVLAVLQLQWTASDQCGHTSQQTITAHVVDQTPPGFVNFQSEVTIGCFDPMPEYIVTDNCGQVTLTTTESIVPGDCPYEYDVMRTITATDPCGNTTSLLQTVHVGNGDGPVIEGVEEELCNTFALPGVTAYDRCADQYVQVTMHEEQLNMPCQEGTVIERTWSAVDACGNVAVKHQRIIMNDHTPPAILIPTHSVILRFMDTGLRVVNLSQSGLMDQLNDLDDFSIFIEDECDEAIIPEFNLDVSYADDCASAGYFERRVYTWVATDVCGNSSVLSISVDIMDDIAPVISQVPAETTIICGPLPAPGTVQTDDYTQAVSTEYSQTMVPGVGPGEFNVTRLWVATDACGNTSAATQHITWIPDTQLSCDIFLPQQVDCNSHDVGITSGISGGLGDITYEWEIFGEKCFIQSGQGTPDLGIYIGWSEVEITLTLTDAYGCSTSCSATLDCEDLAPQPIVSVPGVSDADATYTLAQPVLIPAPVNSREEELKRFNLWPNPANESIQLGFEAASDQRISISLVNFLGQILLAEETNVTKGSNRHSVDVSQIPEGGYLLQLKTVQGTYTKVVMVIRNE